MPAIRTVFMPGADIALFESVMQQFWLVVGCPWRASDGTLLDFGPLVVGAEPLPDALAHAWRVCVSGAVAPDNLRNAAVTPWAWPDGVRVNFLDDYARHGVAGQLGECFREFAEAVAPFLVGVLAQGCLAQGCAAIQTPFTGAWGPELQRQGLLGTEKAVELARQGDEPAQAGGQGAGESALLAAIPACNRDVVRLWQEGYTTSRIAKALDFSVQHVKNMLGQLRQQYGQDVVPYRRK